jgi:two-component system CheB/CheR fusion protein
MARQSPSATDEPWRAAPPQSDSGTSTQQTGEGSRLRSLIFDDLADAADSLARLLRLLGHETLTAYSGQAALRAAQQFLPHAVLLDIGLPALDGYQVARLLRQQPELQTACLIALSGHSGEIHRERARQAGFDECLLKPINIQRLEPLLAEVAAGRCGSLNRA